MKNNKINCNDIVFSNDVDFCLISGPCQIESENHALDLSIIHISEPTRPY